MIKRFLFLFILFSSNFYHSQEVYSFSIHWKKSNSTIFLPNQGFGFFDSSVFSGNKLFFQTYLNISTSVVDFKLNNIETVPVTSYELSYLNYYNFSIPDSVDYKFNLVADRGVSKVAFSVFPFVRKGTSIHKILSFNFFTEKSSHGKRKRGKSNSFVSSSVLSHGHGLWYKYKVFEDGFYKIDYNDLISLGLDISSLSPNSIHIYGNGFGRLPESNADFRPDDLLENSIEIVGGEDGRIDPQDYILFYATSASRLKVIDSLFTRDLNIYSDFACYFLRIDSNESPKRVRLIDYSTFSPTSTVDSYDYFDVHELEDTSLVLAGQRWYGEIYDNILKRDFSFNLPSKAVSPLIYDISIAHNARGLGSKFTISQASNAILDFSIPSVGTDYSRSSFRFSTTSTNLSSVFSTTLTRNNPSVITFLDKIELNTKCELSYPGKDFKFRSISEMGLGSILRYNIKNVTQNLVVYDITDRTDVKIVKSNTFNNVLNFIYPGDTLFEFTSFNGKDFKTPQFMRVVLSQNLHSIEFADLLIVTPSIFLSEANRLARIHQEEGLVVEVVTDEQIYNEFSSGVVDPTAIKWFAKMVYDRSKSRINHSLSSLLLFGDGTFDPKNRIANNNYMLPTYQFLESEDFLSAMVSDDYFGMLDNTESIANSDLLDIGVGRLLISSIEQAKVQVDKIEQYLKIGIQSDSIDCCGVLTKSAFGDWRSRVVQVVDDEEDGYFINKDAEPQSKTIELNHPEMNLVKLYSDAFKQEVQAGGQRYPELQNRLTKEIMNGALVVNYTGHGGPAGAAEERFITIPQINSWTNYSTLPLFVSSTCEFTKYDDPTKISAGEWMVLNPKGGAIALMTTTRPVFFGVNTETGNYFFKQVFQRDKNNKPLMLGEIIRRTKNESSANSNKRSFTLIGDPALRLALPDYKVVVDSINGVSIKTSRDTIKALSRTSVSGHIENMVGTYLPLNGVISPTFFDKSKILSTLGQDTKSPLISFLSQESILFKGRATVKGGRFNFEFITPKDIDFAYGKGKISLYGNLDSTDALGSFDSVYVGGINPKGILDSIGPTISMYLNNERFVNQGLTDNAPKLIVKLKDESGINTTGNGLGHDLILILDNKVSNPIVLNSYYQADLDSYKQGSVVYDFSDLSDGEHHLKLKVWDVNNNPSEKELSFTVRNSSDNYLGRIYNYPNPFTTRTHFFLEYNLNCIDLDVKIDIFTISGKLVKTINSKINQMGVVSEGIAWDGLDEFGDRLAKGVYVYRITTRTSEGNQTEKLEKLVLF
jgi:hypothetical protein